MFARARIMAGSRTPAQLRVLLIGSRLVVTELVVFLAGAVWSLSPADSNSAT